MMAWMLADCAVLRETSPFRSKTFSYKAGIRPSEKISPHKGNYFLYGQSKTIWTLRRCQFHRCAWNTQDSHSIFYLAEISMYHALAQLLWSFHSQRYLNSLQASLLTVRNPAPTGALSAVFLKLLDFPLESLSECSMCHLAINGSFWWPSPQLTESVSSLGLLKRSYGWTSGHSLSWGQGAA